MSEMEANVANVRVRASGTLGGNLAFAEPHSDPATLLLALGGTARAQGRSGERTLAMDELLAGAYENSLARDEVLTGVGGAAAGTVTAFRLPQVPGPRAALARTGSVRRPGR